MRLLTLMATLLLTLPASLVGAPSAEITGDWEGSLDTGERLEMCLTEVLPDSIIGWVILGTPGDSMIVQEGNHPRADSLFVRAESDDGGPPIGCFLYLEGTLLTDDEISGDYIGRCGHDPFFIGNWSAARVETPSLPETWGRLKLRYQGSNLPLQPSPAVGVE